jgi:hypothetical protein
LRDRKAVRDVYTELRPLLIAERCMPVAGAFKPRLAAAERHVAERRLQASLRALDEFMGKRARGRAADYP